MSGIHLVIFCAERYRPVFLKHCVYCADLYIQDRILSRTIVSPDHFHYPGFDTITDTEIWPHIDDTQIHDFFWKKNWLRQQILKLNVDRAFTGNVLILDADLFFLQPMTFMQDNKFNIYLGIPTYFEPYFRVIEHVTGIKKRGKQSFIADFAIFNMDILREMKSFIERRTEIPWVDALHWAMGDPALKPLINDVFQPLSEFELYGMYLWSYHQEKINQMIPPVGRRLRIPLSFDPYSNEKQFLENLHLKSKNHFQCVKYYTEKILWQNFWNQVKDESWPDCASELDFQFLPYDIQKECIKVHHVKKYFRWIPTAVDQ